MCCRRASEPASTHARNVVLQPVFSRHPFTRISPPQKVIHEAQHFIGRNLKTTLRLPETTSRSPIPLKTPRLTWISLRTFIHYASEYRKVSQNFQFGTQALNLPRMCGILRYQHRKRARAVPYSAHEEYVCPRLSSS